MSSSYAATMIRRFREAEPSSRADRAAAKEAGSIKEMWWVDENEAPPRRAPQPVSNTLQSELTATLGAHTLASSMDSVGDKSVDRFIAAEIAELEKEAATKGGRGAGSQAFGSTGGSFDMRRSGDMLSMNRTDKLESATYRYAGGGTRDPLADLRSSGDFFRSSIETLGSTGIKGLLMPDLRLDGKVGDDLDDDGFDDFGLGGDDNAYYRGPIDKSKDPKTKLEDVLKELEEAKLARAKVTGDDGSGKTPEDISKIAMHLEQSMKGLLAPLKEREAASLEEEAARQKRDEEMKEEGRKAEYEKFILDTDRGELDYASNTLLPAFMAKSQAGSSGDSEKRKAIRVAEERADAEKIAGSVVDAATDAAIVKMAGEPPPAFAKSAARSKEASGAAAHPAQYMARIADQEVSIADNLFVQMRALRSDLSQRTRALDVVYASVLEGQQPPQRSLDILNQLNERRKGQLEGGGIAGMTGGRGSSAGMTGDIDAPVPGPRFNPHPELVHKNILGTADAIGSMLDVAMNTLTLRLSTGESSAGAKDASAREKEEEGNAGITDSAPVGDMTDASTDTAVDTAVLVAAAASKVVSAATDSAVTKATTIAATASQFVSASTNAAVERASGAPVPVPAPKTTEAEDSATLAEIDRVLGDSPSSLVAAMPTGGATGLDQFVANIPPVAEAPNKANNNSNVSENSVYGQAGVYRYGPLVVHDFKPFSLPSSTPASQSQQYSQYMSQPSAPMHYAFPYSDLALAPSKPQIPTYKPVVRPPAAVPYDTQATRPPPTRPVEGTALFGLRNGRSGVDTATMSAPSSVPTPQEPVSIVVPSPAQLRQFMSGHAPVPSPSFVGAANAPITERRQYLETMRNMRSHMLAC